MGVTVTLKHLRELGRGRWEYRRRVPESAKAAMGKAEWKRVFTARDAAAIARGHAKVDAAFIADLRAALLGKAPAPSLVSPRKAFDAALRRAEGMIAGASGLDEYETRGIVAEGNGM